MAKEVRKIQAQEQEGWETCRDCFCWQTVRGVDRCVLSGEKRLGAMKACQYVDSRRKLLALGAGNFSFL